MEVSRRGFLSYSVAGLCSMFFMPISYASPKPTKEVSMSYEAKEFHKCFGMEGFSETLMNNHMTLYKGYVNNTNKLLELCDSMARQGKLDGVEFAELKRRLGWEFNGMRLHEYYFENLGGKAPLNVAGKLAQAIKTSFGSLESWEREFKAIGAMRGIGWVILYQDTNTKRLINFWINEHDVGHPAGLIPLLVMDVFEHAYMIDYGLKKAQYIEAFFKNIDWQVVESRMR